MPWWDFYKLWTYTFEKGPLEKRRERQRDMAGAGIGIPEAIPDLRGEAWGGGSQGQVRLHASNEFVDLQSVTNRISRYREYERLRNVAEIEMAMTVMADEACVVGNTKISTVFDGFRTIRWLTERWEQDRKPFLVYCYDFDKEDYTFGWAYDPRLVKKSDTIKIALDDGRCEIVTPDHRLLLADGSWIHAGELKIGDELLPFYRMPPNRLLNDLTVGQFPRIYSFKDGWKHERQMIDEWRTGYTERRYQRVNEAARLIANGLPTRQVAKIMEHQWKSIGSWLKKEGFSVEELKWLGGRKKVRRVLAVMPHHELNVYDLSVKEHENFCTDSVVMHNCQRGDNNHIFKIHCDNSEVVEELEFLLFNRKMLNLDRRIWNMTKRLIINGDGFYELLTNPEKPSDGILKIQDLPADSMYRIESTKCRLIEFQQSKEGPDFHALTRSEVTKATEADLQQSTAIRFSPHQVIHFRIGDDRRTFYPYGQSLIEPARGPAHQLRLMEDAMVVYRLTRAPERRVFYIDVGSLPAFKAEAFMERLKDQFRKKKVATSRGGATGANAVEERWHAPAADEDYWLPIRPNANTRIETLPGAQNLGEIDDALYFRNKLFSALHFPRNYFNNEDPGQTRITLSAQDIKFARMIERIQSNIVDGIIELSERHLEMRGFPEESYEDLQIDMTPPSAWKELSEAEVINQRINWITSLKGSMIMCDQDLLTRYGQIPEDEAVKIEARNKIQKLEELKLQIIGQNPQLLGVGVPGQPQGEEEMGAEAGGPSPMLGEQPPGGQPPGGGEQPPGEQPPGEEPTAGAPAPAGGQPPATGAAALAEPDREDIKRYDLDIEDYSREADAEDIDFSTEL
jgi:hypothetical protein